MFIDIVLQKKFVFFFSYFVLNLFRTRLQMLLLKRSLFVFLVMLIGLCIKLLLKVFQRLSLY